MLGLGRALGETMAVAMVLSPAAVISFVLTSSQNPSTIASNIALNYPEAHGVGVNVLIATGLILFVITFLVNSVARWRREPPQGILGSELMTTDHPHRSRTPSTAGKLPKAAPWATARREPRRHASSARTSCSPPA